MRLLSVVVLLVGSSCIYAAGPAPPAPTPIDLTSFNNDESFAVKATIGGQDLNLAIDALGTNTKVAGVDCWQCCNKATLYDPSKSKATGQKCTADATTPANQNCQDSLQVGTFSVGADKFSFTEVTSAPAGDAFAAAPTDGILGLALDTTTKYGLFLKRTCAASDTVKSTLTLGGLDTNTNCNSDANNVDVALAAASATDPTLTASLASYQIGAATAVTPKAPATSWPVTFTTTSPYVIIPKGVYSDLNKNYWHTVYEAATDSYRVDCASTGTYGDVKLTFGGKVLTIPVKQLVYQDGDDHCSLRVRPSTDDGPSWTIGLPIFRSYCTLIDLTQAAKKITFTTHKGTAPADTCTYTASNSVKQCIDPAGTTTPTAGTNGPENTTKGASGHQAMSVMSAFAIFMLAFLF